MQTLKIFFTGTGTDVGKTFLSTAYCIGSSECNKSIAYWKPVQTGSEDLSDSKMVQKFSPETKIIDVAFSYPLPTSPDQAALNAKKNAPTIKDLSFHYQSLKLDQDLIIEGAGGLFVPLNQSSETWLDFIQEENLPVIVVAQSGLGTINHTSLTIRALENSGCQVLAVILNGPLHLANESSLGKMHPTIAILSFPKVESLISQDAKRHCKKLFLDIQLLIQSKSENWLPLDKRFCWHPYTQHKAMPTPMPITRARGIYLFDDQGKKYIDGTSSWWANTIGHGRKEIGQAIHRQQQTLDHTIFAGATHRPAVTLAERLSSWSEGLLTRSFYSDNGSCAVEIALKMAIQAAHNRGEFARNQFITLKGAYHGDTFGAMSAGGTSDFHSPFKDFMFKTIQWEPVTRHKSSICPDGPESLNENIKNLDKLFAEKHQSLAGVLIEPLVQGASGMNMQVSAWTRHLATLCKKYQVPLILDEVFTGMGRCGDKFAFMKLGIQPDIVCIAKGLTGGTLPLAVTLTTETIFQEFYSDQKSKALLHGHTYTGNAIACAAANAALDIYENEGLIEKAIQIETRFSSWIKTNEIEKLENPRCEGSILAFEIPGSGLGNYFNPIAQKIPEIAKKYRIFLRPLGNTVYFLPALTINLEELETALEGLTALSQDIRSGGN